MDTVRLYTRLGLVPCQPRQAGSRLYADYDDSAVTLVKGIKIAQSIGFTLSELGPVAAAYIAGPPFRPTFAAHGSIAAAWQDAVRPGRGPG
jgi:MerR family transcriptional regulator, copper efflux regulator